MQGLAARNVRGGVCGLLVGASGGVILGASGGVPLGPPAGPRGTVGRYFWWRAADSRENWKADTIIRLFEKC